MAPTADEEGPEVVRLPPEAMSAWMLTAGSTDARRLAKHRLVDATRLLINAVTMLDVNPLDPDDPAVDALTAAMEEMTARVAGLPVLPGGPVEAGGDDARLLERSGISGLSNPLSAPLHIWTEGDRVLGWAKLPPASTKGLPAASTVGSWPPPSTICWAPPRPLLGHRRVHRDAHDQDGAADPVEPAHRL